MTHYSQWWALVVVIVAGGCESLEISADAGPPSDAAVDGAPPDVTLSQLGESCQDQGACQEPFVCFFAGPGDATDLGFCTQRCSSPEECGAGYSGPGIPDCVFFEVAGENVCAVRCDQGGCPGDLTCVTSPDGGICDSTDAGA